VHSIVIWMLSHSETAARLRAVDLQEPYSGLDSCQPGGRLPEMHFGRAEPRTKLGTGQLAAPGCNLKFPS
jgi:hypothetical protein